MILYWTDLFVSVKQLQVVSIKKKGALKNFAKFTEKHLCQSLYFNKVAGLRPVTLVKKRLWHRCFLVNILQRW